MELVLTHHGSIGSMFGVCSRLTTDKNFLDKMILIILNRQLIINQNFCDVEYNWLHWLFLKFDSIVYIVF